MINNLEVFIMKKIYFILITLLCITNICIAQSNERWQCYFQDEPNQRNIYIDTQTIDYNSANNTLEFWEKLCVDGNDPAPRTLIHYKVKLNNKRYLETEVIHFVNNTTIKHTNTKQDDFIIVESLLAKAIETICAQKNIPFIFKPTQWQWFYSDSYYTYEVDTNNVTYTFENDGVYLWVKEIRPSHKISTIYMFKCDFQLHKVYKVVGHGELLAPIEAYPDTMGETLYNTAYAEFHK